MKPQGRILFQPEADLRLLAEFSSLGHRTKVSVSWLLAHWQVFAPRILSSFGDPSHKSGQFRAPLQVALASPFINTLTPARESS